MARGADLFDDPSILTGGLNFFTYVALLHVERVKSFSGPATIDVASGKMRAQRSGDIKDQESAAFPVVPGLIAAKDIMKVHRYSIRYF